MKEKKINNKIDEMKKRLVNDKDRIHLQFVAVFLAFSVISFGMTAINLVTGYKMLMYVTLIFGGLNIVNSILALTNDFTEKLSRVLFGIEIVALITYFVLFGEPEGFSAIWAALLPVAGMLVYRRLIGSIISIIQFLIIVFFFWTPYGSQFLQYTEYTESFKLRFPILFIAFFAVGYLFELLREYTQDELVDLTKRYKKLSYTDMLTGLGNETAYFKMLDSIDDRIKKHKVDYAIAVMDVNGLKHTDDTYGHRFGCQLIIKTGQTLPSIFPTSKLFHVGGDEFYAIIIGDDYKHLEERISDFKQTLGYTIETFEGVDLELSVSIGYSVYTRGEKYNDVFQRADQNMYEDKKFLKEKFDIPSR